MKKFVVEEEYKFTFFLDYVKNYCGNEKFKPSKTLIKKNIRKKIFFLISPNSKQPDKRIYNPKYKVKVDDIIFIPSHFFGENEITKKVNEEITVKKEDDDAPVKKQKKSSKVKKLDIIHESTSFLIVNKPRGMLIHVSEKNFLKQNSNSEVTLVDALLKYCGEDDISNYEGKFRSGIVHRIDRNTSGVLIVAKNNGVHEYFKNLFMYNHDMICRVYVCLVFNHFTKNNKGTIDKRIGRHSSNFMKRVVESEETMGKSKTFKEAVTHYKVVEEFEYKKKKYSLLHCRLETGRTHQIRVHLSSIGRSIVGDTLYGMKEKIQPFRNINVVRGVRKKKGAQMLHAMTIGFIHPTTEEYVEYSSELPQYFKDILELLRKKKKSE